MVIEITAAVAAGLGIGAGVMYRIQRRQRTQELKEIEKAAEEIMEGHILADVSFRGRDSVRQDRASARAGPGDTPGTDG